MRTLAGALSLALCVAVDAQTYSTSFNVNQDPISENGAWRSNASVGSFWWHNVKVDSGMAKGVENYPNWWQDAVAILSGTWGADQTLQATVWSRADSSDPNLEVELRLRSSLSANTNAGYECLFNVSKRETAYMYIVRWNGPEKNFEILRQNSGPSFGVANGDVVKATIVGNVITSYVNGVLKMQAIDNVYTTGAPGIGFDHNAPGTNEEFGFADFTATANGTSEVLRIFTGQAVAPVTGGCPLAAFDLQGRLVPAIPPFTRAEVGAQAAEARVLRIEDKGPGTTRRR